MFATSPKNYIAIIQLYIIYIVSLLMASRWRLGSPLHLQGSPQPQRAWTRDPPGKQCSNVVAVQEGRQMRAVHDEMDRCIESAGAAVKRTIYKIQGAVEESDNFQLRISWLTIAVRDVWSKITFSLSGMSMSWHYDILQSVPLMNSWYLLEKIEPQ